MIHTRNASLPTLALAAGYLIITLPISLWTQSLEQRAKFDT